MFVRRSVVSIRNTIIIKGKRVHQVFVVTIIVNIIIRVSLLSSFMYTYFLLVAPLFYCFDISLKVKDINVFFLFKQIKVQHCNHENLQYRNTINLQKLFYMSPCNCTKKHCNSTIKCNGSSSKQAVHNTSVKISHLM